jgi:hypothetical protein
MQSLETLLLERGRLTLFRKGHFERPARRVAGRHQNVVCERHWNALMVPNWETQTLGLTAASTVNTRRWKGHRPRSGAYKRQEPAMECLILISSQGWVSQVISVLSEFHDFLSVRAF